MRRIAALCLAGLLGMGGCPSQQEIPSVVTVLTAGSYSGTVDCTTKATDKADQASQSVFTAEVTEQGQLYIWDVPYYEGLVLDMSDSTKGITGSVTIQDVSESGSTLTATGDGTLSDSAVTYAMNHAVTLTQSSATELAVTYLTAGESAAASKSLELSCGGTITKQ